MATVDIGVVGVSITVGAVTVSNITAITLPAGFWERLDANHLDQTDRIKIKRFGMFDPGAWGFETQDTDLYADLLALEGAEQEATINCADGTSFEFTTATTKVSRTEGFEIGKVMYEADVVGEVTVTE